MPMLVHGRGRHRSDHDSWNSLRLFLSYRLGLSLLLVLMYVFGAVVQPADPELAALFPATAFALLTVNLLLVPLTFFQAMPFRRLVTGMVLLDIVAFTLLMHASADRGISLLMIPSIAGASLLLPGIIAPFFAAVATLAILGETVWGIWLGRYELPQLTQAGLQSLILFAVALLAAKLARKADTSEALARQRDRDLASLTELNTRIVEQIDTGVIVAGDNGRVWLINQAAWQILGLSGPRPPLQLQALCPGLHASLSRWLLRQDRDTTFVKAERPSAADFEARFVRVGSGAQQATLIFMTDMNVRARQLQDIKLAALGRLTASIAHEIRNPLGAIDHAAQLLGESDALPPADVRLVEIIRNNTRRVNAIIENVLSLSRRKTPHVQVFALRPWLERLLQEYRNQPVLKDMDIRLDVPDSKQKVAFDPDQLHQVLWNLLMNAHHHARRDADLVVHIRGGMEPEARYAWLEIEDNGQGIPAADVERLFEPFFTTGKRATGLGLYIARELCESNGGSLEYVPGGEGGARFRIRLPIAA